jgi:hypothetical protein
MNLNKLSKIQMQTLTQKTINQIKIIKLSFKMTHPHIITHFKAGYVVQTSTMF